MALNNNGRGKILNTIESEFVQLRLTGTSDLGLPGAESWQSDTKTSIGTWTKNNSAGTIGLNTNQVFSITLGSFTNIRVIGIEMMDSVGTVLLTKSFPTTYDYFGDGTFTVSSLVITVA